MSNELKINEEWYKELIDDCKAIITESVFSSSWILIEGYHKLGLRLLEENDNFKRAKIYGLEISKRVSQSLNKSQRMIEKSIQLANTYPNLSDLPSGKNVSLRKVFNEILPNHNEDINIEFEPKIYNIWNFVDDDKYGVKHFGQQPPGEIFNLLYYYTNENDLVYDAFAGGGLVNDICLKMNRKCYSTDIKPVRDFIKQVDITKELPDIQPNFIYLDPPYPIISKGKYSQEPTDLSNMSTIKYFEYINNLMKRVKEKYKNCYIAFIIGGTERIDGGLDYGFEIYKILIEYFIPIRRIIVPYSTQNYQAYHVIRAKEGKYMLNLYRDLMIFKTYGQIQ